MLIATYYPEQDRLYLNDGSGVFNDASDKLPAEVAFDTFVLLGDVDGDQDLDALVGSNGQGVHANLSRHVAWRGIPRIGKPLSVDIYGTPGGRWLLAWSPGTASIAFPPFGTLMLDPAGLHIAGAGEFGPEGLASMTFDVPDTPALVGASLYWQGLIGEPLLASNLERTTFTDL